MNQLLSTIKGTLASVTSTPDLVTAVVLLLLVFAVIWWAIHHKATVTAAVGKAEAEKTLLLAKAATETASLKASLEADARAIEAEAKRLIGIKPAVVATAPTPPQTPPSQ